MISPLETLIKNIIKTNNLFLNVQRFLFFDKFRGLIFLGKQQLINLNVFLRIQQSKQTKKPNAIVEQAIKKSDMNGEQV
uniref:Uncharacterized protein n=1 Tax=Meloidogyne incognita TaxID=6306 RepID=A0A914L523_MELIC